MIDSADVGRLDVVKREIETLLAEAELKGAALLVFANKQDIQGALSEGEIAERLELAKKCKERYHLQPFGLYSRLTFLAGIGVFAPVVRLRMRVW